MSTLNPPSNAFADSLGGGKRKKPRTHTLSRRVDPPTLPEEGVFLLTSSSRDFLDLPPELNL